ncbi:MAG: S41 family peptidase [Chloroflexi bacterium]|nr:S41 family peptidase [Chloroflexota bacterium]MCI0814368.1 S41 family peptidase [Chloroflexota bacterium]MCI0817388.1 S41 family peptidase [Chloroflexota bacterium]MCI0819811.1 S41 family peptidase [Chloroflexota bacterium]MCI0832360.1 S41 family peptidase [Chloroflexota bacterium]
MWNTVKLSLGLTFVALIVAFGGALGFALGENDGGSSAGSATVPNSSTQFGILDEIADILKDDFVNPAAVTDEALQQGSIQGIIDELGDPHTVYITPESYQSGFDLIGGTFEGIGATVDQDSLTGEIVIVTPFRGSPAEEAGIRPGDAILAVDGESTEGWSVQDAVSQIRGPDGSTVTLTVRHTDRETEDVAIVRGTIVFPTVFFEEVLDENGEVVPELAYIEIQQFTERTIDGMREALKEVEEGGYSGLILDLRLNPGGGLDATVQVTSMFLDGGLVLTQVDRDGIEIPYEARPGGEATEIPVVILVGPNSASGSEVLAGALRDHGRAQLVGDQTFGKGSVNHLRELSNGGALYVTIARWLTPNGDLIEGVGLTPDVQVDTTPEELESGSGPQLFAAIDLLEQQLAAAAQ